MSRFAVVSHSLPPSWSGQSVILEKLLRGFDPERYVLVSTRPPGLPDAGQQFIRPLSARTLEVGAAPRLPLARISRRLEGAFRLTARTASLVSALRRERVETVVVCTGDLLDLPAAWVASRLLGLRMIPYLFDDYRTQWLDPVHRGLAERVEPRVMRAASAVIVPNEFLRDRIQERHGVEAHIVRNAVEGAQDPLPSVPWPARPGPVRVAYTGAVYHAHYDAFRNLVRALERLERPAELHLYTTQTREQLAAEGITGPVVLHEHLPSDRIRAVQREADVLFLPLAFESAIPEVIRTSAPGKTGEYLASGRPILVHAPADSFVCDYFRRHACGFVADVPSPDALAETLRLLVEQPAERTDRAKRAAERAAVDFDVEVARAALARALDLQDDA